MMISKHVPAIAAIAALAIPTAAVAKPAQAGGEHGKAQAHAKGQAKGHAKPKNAVFKGTVVSTDTTAGTVTVHVTKVNHLSKTFKGSDVTFTVATVKKINVADTNNDGKRDLADVQAGDAVLVQARITKDSAQPFAARKLNDLAGDDDTEAPEAPEQPES
jgi:hypothetical protein